MFLYGLTTIAIMLYGSRSPRVVHGYVLASAISDPLHWASIINTMGWDNFVDYKGWSQDVTPIILVPAFTLAIKVGYLTGLFGKDKVVKERSD